ncbi:glycosyltransferase family 2 protein [Brucella pseudogrignonensis]|uniref:glycosyltransferase family 2 protein n=1 Tax=Brucella pseudogrignonensis TaxID=419475 RepID=UPI0038B5897A
MIYRHLIAIEESSSNPIICGVIVTYNPDLTALEDLIKAIRPQLTHLVIVDNGSANAFDKWLASSYPDVELELLESNLGIAKAQNVGIIRCQKHAPQYFLLLDQDSVPASNMVSKLVDAIEDKQKSGVKVASAGPRYFDRRQGNALPFIETRGLTLHRCTCSAVDDVVDVDYLIASGCLIPLTAIEEVGLMQEDLFIDYVDIEWGLRAQQKGFQSLGVCAAFMEHQLGDNPINFLGRNIPVHSPLRHYYHFRNAIWLYRQPWLRNNWKIVDAMRLIRKLVFYSSVTHPRFEHFKMMILGIWHGATGRMGRK